MTFFIVMFVLLMQFLWKYIDDLVGKGLDWTIISELLLYASAGLVPMALPLSTLLASLMTLGNLGENNELLAMKSAGISLPRIMLPLIVVTILISSGAFFFSNNVLPYTNLKITSLLYDVKQQRPELQLKEGVFYNGIEGMSVKIGEKNHNTNLLKRIMIYDHRSNDGNITVTVADSGYMRVTTDERHLVVTLYNGYTYEEVKEGREPVRNRDKKLPARKTHFAEQTFIHELKGFGLQRTDEELFKNNFQVMNLAQLDKAQDSLSNELRFRNDAFKKNLVSNIVLRNVYRAPQDTVLVAATYKLITDTLYSKLNNEQKLRAIERALVNARSAKSYISTTSDEINYKAKYIARHKIEWHRKFALSFACFVFFFIGAPLGAIIRKGGLGMPVVISVLFFILYYVIAITGEKFVRELVWHPTLGMWISSVILLPLGAFLSYKATTDSVILNADWYVNTFKKVFSFKGKRKQKEPVL